MVVNFLYPWLCFCELLKSLFLFLLSNRYPFFLFFYVICNYFSTLYSYVYLFYFISYVFYTPQIAFYVQLQQIYKLDWQNVVCGRRDKISCSYFCCKGLVRWIHALNKEGKCFTNIKWWGNIHRIRVEKWQSRIESVWHIDAHNKQNKKKYKTQYVIIKCHHQIVYQSISILSVDFWSKYYYKW